MFTLLHDIRIAMRFLGRHRLFAGTSVAILALGISLSATLFAIVTPNAFGMLGVPAFAGRTLRDARASRDHRDAARCVDDVADAPGARGDGDSHVSGLPAGCAEPHLKLHNSYGVRRSVRL